MDGARLFYTPLGSRSLHGGWSTGSLGLPKRPTTSTGRRRVRVRAAEMWCYTLLLAPRGRMRENQTSRDPFFRAQGDPASSSRIRVPSKAELGASGITFANVIPTVLGLWTETFFVFLAM